MSGGVVYSFANRVASAKPDATPRHQVVPHTTDPTALQRQALIYRQGRTPLTRPDGSLTASESRPGPPELAGVHLGQIQAHFGDRGLDSSVAGLAITRGHSFASIAILSAPASVQARAAARVETSLDETGSRAAGASRTSRQTDSPGIVASDVRDAAAHSAGRLIASAGPGIPLAQPYRSRLSSLAGERLDDVRVHDDPHSHDAARLLNARAFMLGRSIYLGDGEYHPHTADGFRLLAHEVAHTVQQRGAVAPVLSRKIEVESVGSAHELEADRFADSAVRREPAGPRLNAGSVRAARAMRVIGFTGTAGAPAKVDPTAAENGAGTHLQIARGTPPGPYFDWTGTYTITGSAGDPFANFAIFPVQVTRSMYENVFWGTGTDRTTRRLRIPTPARDSTTGSVHYDDGSGSAAFAAAGDARMANLNDTPGTLAAVTPFANPLPPRAGTRGWFNWGMALVAYLGARDSTVAGAAGFRPLNFCYWNLSVDGNWDITRPLGARVNANGRTNVGSVGNGSSAEFPPMFGGVTTNALINDPANITLT